MNKEQQELLDEAYENYLKGGHIKWLNQMEVNTPAGKMNIPVPYTQEEFINKCKTEDALSLKWREEYRNLQYGSKEEIEHLSKHYTSDTEFSEKWGLKIEERELSFEERCEIQIARLEGMYSSGKEVFIQHSVNDVKQITMDKNNIPTKLITITYNNKKIESHE
jgi:hypothetical protein